VIHTHQAYASAIGIVGFDTCRFPLRKKMSSAASLSPLTDFPAQKRAINVGRRVLQQGRHVVLWLTTER
jgi:hypothetical protein